MDTRLTPGESYLVESGRNVRYLGLKDARAYFSLKDGKIFIVALASQLERIGNSIQFKNPFAKFCAGDLDMFSKRDRANIEALANELEGATN